MSEDIIKELRENFSLFCSLYVKEKFPLISSITPKPDFVEAFIFSRLPILFLDEYGKLWYLNNEETVKDLSFELKGTITEKTLSSFMITETSLKERLKSVNKNKSEEIKELMYHLISWLEVYEKEFHDLNNPKVIKKGTQNNAIKIIKWLSIPIYVFGYPRSLLIFPNIYQKTHKIAYEEILKISSAITRILENVLWDIFIKRVNKLIEGEKKIEEAFLESLGILIPLCLRNNCNFKTEIINFNNIKQLPIILPDESKVDKNISDSFKTKQKSLFERLKSYISYWNSIKLIISSHALRSAVAAIIGRNASHTIGSHSLSYLSETHNLLEYSDENKSKFFKYLQGRMDYIAEVSTTEPKWCETVEFKNQIILPFLKQVLLIDNINRSEYVIDNSGSKKEMRAEKYKFNLIIGKPNEIRTYQMFYVRENNKLVLQEWKPLNGTLNGTLCELNEDDRKWDILVDCPHGIVGSHAFYSFMENFIRNSAKHGGQKIRDILLNNNEKLEITIEVDATDSNSDLIKVKVRDNLSNFENKNKVDKYISGEEKEFIDQTAKLKGGAWGIYEMRIGTGWLRMADVMEVSTNSLNPPVLKVDNLNNNITYEFYLLKPLDILIVSNNSQIKADETNGIFKINNIEELEEFYNQRKLRHKFILIDAENNEDYIDWLKKQENQIKLPFRTFVFNTKKEESLKNRYICINEKIESYINSSNLLEKLYKDYVKWLNDANMPEELPTLGIGWGDLSNGNPYKIENDNIKNLQIYFRHSMKNFDVNEIKGLLYFQPFSSAVPENIVGRRISAYKDDPNNQTPIWELYELGLTKILIADERIFKKVGEKTISSLEGVNLEKDFPLWQVLKWLEIEVIDIKRENDDIYVYSYLSDGIKKEKIARIEKEEIKNFLKGKKEWTFFLIHQGIIDETLKEEFKSELEQTFSAKCRCMIIHSGRGEVKVERGYKFLELSNLENYVVENPNKYRLVHLLCKITGGKR